MEEKKLTRKSYYCNDEVNDLVKSYSENLGISESAFVNICIDTYHTQKVAIHTMGNLDEILGRLESLEKTFSSESQKSK